MKGSLQTYLMNQASFSNDDVIDAFVHQFNARFNDSLIAVVFYGSCVRSKEYKNAVLDFYVIVDNYSCAYQNRWHAILNKVLPPNVFFSKTQVNDVVYQAKFAVVSQSDLHRRTSLHAFHPYFWARFMQPIAIVYSRTKKDFSWLIEIQRQAAMTFYTKTKPLLVEEGSSQSLWVNGLRLTYSAELRAESGMRADVLYEANSDYYDFYSNELFHIEKGQGSVRKVAVLDGLRWKLCVLYGKYISIWRLLKATQTFEGGVDYIAWKIHRHTGEEIIVSDNLRKHPWLYCWPLLLRLYKKGKIR